MPKQLIDELIRLSPDKEIRFRISMFGDDIFISISGGEEHLGALSFYTEKEKHTLVDAPHKERQITEMIAGIFSKDFKQRRIVVVSGIHFDGLLKSEIKDILDICKRWANNAVKTIP